MQSGGEIVNDKSHGILLHGLTRVRNEYDEVYCVVAQDKLLENVNDNQVAVEKENEMVEIKNVFCTQTESMQFQERVTRTRNAIGGSIGLSAVGFGGVEIGLKKGKKVKIGGHHQTTTSTIYLSQNQIRIIRKLSLKLKKDGLRFSEAAYNNLDRIVKATDRKEIYEQCRAFFMKYGSHVDLGKCYLGGVAEIVSECKRVKELAQITKDDEKNTKKLIGVAVAGGYSFAAGKLKLTADAVKDKQNIFAGTDGTDLQNYTMRAHIYGGYSTASFPDWENSLNQGTTDLHITDRGCLKTLYTDHNGIAMTDEDKSDESDVNHEAVWKLLRSQQHKVAFAKAEKNMSFCYKTFLYRERIIEIINGIREEPDAVKYLMALTKIYKVNEWRKKEVKNLDEWGQFIEDDDTFLNFVNEMDSLSVMHSNVLTKIIDTLETLMEQVEKEQVEKEPENFQRVIDINAMIKAKRRKFTPEIVETRKRVETTFLENRGTEDGVAYSRALTTILKNVKALKQETGNDSFWINMLSIDSVYKFLLKPKKYMSMTLKTFKEVIHTIEELTQEPARMAALPKKQKITSLVYKNQDLIEKIEFWANVRQYVDTAQDYQKALEDIRNEVNTTLHDPEARKKALTELLRKDKSVVAFIQKAVNMKMNKKTLSDVSDIVVDLFEYVDQYDPNRQAIEADIEKQMVKQKVCTLS